LLISNKLNLFPTSGPLQTHPIFSRSFEDVGKFAYCLDAFLADPNFSALAIPMVFAHASSSGARAQAVVEAAKRTDKPLAVIWMNEWHQGPGSEVFDANPRVTILRSDRRGPRARSPQTRSLSANVDQGESGRT